MRLALALARNAKPAKSPPSPKSPKSPRGKLGLSRHERATLHAFAPMSPRIKGCGAEEKRIKDGLLREPTTTGRPQLFADSEDPEKDNINRVTPSLDKMRAASPLFQHEQATPTRVCTGTSTSSSRKALTPARCSEAGQSPSRASSRSPVRYVEQVDALRKENRELQTKLEMESFDHKAQAMRDRAEIESLRGQCHEAISSERKMSAQLEAMQRQERKRLEREGMPSEDREAVHKLELKQKDELISKV